MANVAMDKLRVPHLVLDVERNVFVRSCSAVVQSGINTRVSTDAAFYTRPRVESIERHALPTKIVPDTNSLLQTNNSLEAYQQKPNAF